MTSIGSQNISRRTAAQAAVSLLAAAAMKQYYSTASANDLRWILRPTKTVVEWVTGTKFFFESHAGYMSEDHSFLIAASCSGVNFLIAVFMLLSLRRLWDRRHEGVAWPSIVWIALLSYVLTLVANALRISGALWLNSGQDRFAWMDRDELHRLDGILVYFGVIMLVYVVYERMRKERRVLSWRACVFPLTIYYSVTLAVPVINGALGDAKFLKHAAFVFVIPVVIVGVLVLAGVLLGDRHREGGAARAALLPGNLGTDQAGPGANV